MKVYEMPNVKPDGLYSVRKTAELLGYSSVETIRHWIKKGAFKSHEMKQAQYGKREMRLTGASIQRVWRASLLGKPY